MKTKVTLIRAEGIFKEGDKGRIEGFVNGSSGVPCAVVKCKRRFDAVPLSALETI
jgi:hypothetical protein